MSPLRSRSHGRAGRAIPASSGKELCHKQQPVSSQRGKKLDFSNQLVLDWDEAVRDWPRTKPGSSWAGVSKGEPDW